MANYYNNPRRAGMSYFQKKLFEQEYPARFKTKEEEIMHVGEYAVFLKDRNINKLNDHPKDIWKIMSIDNDSWGSAEVTLASIRNKNKDFETDIDNIIDIEVLNSMGKFKREFFIQEAYDKYNALGGDKLRKNKVKNLDNNMVKRTVDANVDAAKVAATITAGKTLNGLIAAQLRDRKVLPVMVRGYADTPLGTVVIANIIDFGVKQFMANNAKAQLASDAMMQAAMVDFLSEFDFEGMFNDILSNVSLGELEQT